MDYQTPQDPFNSHGMSAVPPKRRRPRLLLVAVLSLCLAAGIIALVALIPGLIASRTQPVSNASSGSGKPTEVQIQCAAIKHEYVAWKKTDVDFSLLTSSKERLVADMRMRSVSEATDAFHKAASGYTDHPSKDLALSISKHNYDLSVINLELTMSNVINVENHDKAKQSRHDVEKKYESLLVLTCA